MKVSSNHRFIIYVTLVLGLVLLTIVSFQLVSIQQSSDDTLSETSGNDSLKQKGAHYFGSYDSSGFQVLARTNAEWATLVAWSGQDDYDSPEIRHHNGDSAMMQKMDSNRIKHIQQTRAAGFKVFVKPHVWIDYPTAGKWRSDIFPTNDTNWIAWQKDYRDFILRYAHISEQGKAEMFCIGTEFTRLSTEKPDFWKKLIKEVRSIYSGKITYAANWYYEYENISFWEDLDYIGIQAYFPLAKNENPSIQQISKGWKKYFPTLEAISKQYNRKIIFTELGYKSTTDSAINPWEWVDDDAASNKTYSGETQANCYQAFFDMFWDKKWFAGVHIWRFRSDNEKKQLGFTPLYKPAEAVITKGFE